jgi:uncharacterized protein (TIGR03083 family)
MDDVFGAYQRTRSRVSALFEEADADELARTVPACPAWSVHDLAAHLVGIPSALAAGRRPSGDIDGWLQELVDERRDHDVERLMTEWLALDAALEPMLHGTGARMFADLAVHEHDLRRALDRPDHDALEVAVIMPRTLAAFARPLQDGGLGAIVVDHDGRTWCSHDADAGWTLFVDPWEAVRAVNSRRTIDELRALPSDGDVEPYLPILEAHLPLPHQPLGD